MSYFTQMKSANLETIEKMETTSFREIRNTGTSQIIEYTKRINSNECIVARILHTNNREDVLLSAKIHWIL